MSGLQPVRGTRDLIGEECRRFRHIARTAAEIVSLYGFQEIETPILESSAVFLRTLGETSDVVSKQMYIFADRGGDEVTLRPEGTAGVARAFISEGLGQHLPLKLYYAGPMFRYERPQKGRYRQFQQFGVELLGVDDVQADIEVISAGARVLQALKIDHLTRLQLNTIGDAASRENYRQSLVSYLRGHIDRLSEDSRVRLEKNPLRILDSKDPGDREVLKNAPLFPDFLNEPSKAFFARLQDGLASLDIAFSIEPSLVRGLDYYCHTVFEFTTDAIGAQNAVIAGGRYDGLIKSMGGPHTPGVGWAAGQDRLALMLPELPPPTRPVAIIPLGEAAEREALVIADRIRGVGLPVDVGYGGNMSKRMKRADKIGASVAVILGENELSAGIAQIKDLSKGTQTEVPLKGLTDYLMREKN